MVFVVGVDGSDRSWRAVAYAIGVAERLATRCRLHFCYVSPSHLRYSMTPEAVHEAATCATLIASQISTELRRRLAGADVDWVFDTRTGRPLAVLVELARKNHADAVIVGSSRPAGYWLGASISLRLLRRNRWPVIVIP
jgi:nucleotide-binding universal stress UspA family protein